MNEDMKQLQERASEASALLKTMSNESRLMILCTLQDQEMTVGELNNLIPLSQSALSQHLAALRKAQLVQTRKESQQIYYTVTSDKPAHIIGALKHIYCPS